MLSVCVYQLLDDDHEWNMIGIIDNKKPGFELGWNSDLFGKYSDSVVSILLLL